MSRYQRWIGRQMLKGIDRLLTPDLLFALASMGHGDEICLADANFPAAHIAAGKPLIRLPGIDGARALKAVLSVLPLDGFVPRPAAVMAVVGDPSAVPAVVAEYRAILGPDVGVEFVERFAFYDRARRAFAVVATGEARKYGNILLRKGVIASD
jgi:L-fucose mutarotase